MMRCRELGAVVGAFLFTSCGGDGGASPPGKTEHEKVEVHGTGYVEPESGLRRLAFKHRGIVGEVAVKEGERVEKGALIMKQLAGAEEKQVALAQAELLLAEAALAEVLAGVNPARVAAARSREIGAKANLNRWKVELERQRVLLAKNATSTTLYEEAQRQASQYAAELETLRAETVELETFVTAEDKAVAEAQIEVARVQLEAAKQRLADSELRAPVAGVVLDLIRRGGDTSGLGSGSVDCVFGDTSALVVRAEIDERSALGLKIGQRAVVEVGGRALEGKLVSVKPLMGKKSVFTRSATERKDLDVRQVLIGLPKGTVLPVGLEVDVRVRLTGRSIR